MKNFKVIFRKLKSKIAYRKLKKRAKKLNITFEGNIYIGKNIENLQNTKIFMKNGSRVGDNVRFWGGGNIYIGKESSVGKNSWLFAHSNNNGGIVIGDYVNCASNLYIIDSNHMFNKNALIKDQPMTSKKIEIGSDVWIGVNCTILPGAKIPDGCVVGACSLVNKEFNPYEIIAGSPAKKLKDRE